VCVWDRRSPDRQRGRALFAVSRPAAGPCRGSCRVRRDPDPARLRVLGRMYKKPTCRARSLFAGCRPLGVYREPERRTTCPINALTRVRSPALSGESLPVEHQRELPESGNPGIHWCSLPAAQFCGGIHSTVSFQWGVRHRSGRRRDSRTKWREAERMGTPVRRHCCGAAWQAAADWQSANWHVGARRRR
jgi:hypothetical protein